VPLLLLHRFRELFEGKKYIHRDSTLGDSVAKCLPEDLFTLARSQKLVERIQAGNRVINAQNLRQGVASRRGDGTFGELVPGVEAVRDTGFKVGRGPVATIEIGTEVKILAKAMIKQIDRVMGDLIKQVQHFQRGSERPICVGIVGINHADHCYSYERDRVWVTDGKTHKHPIEEAAEAERRIIATAGPHYDELLILRYRATNSAPYQFRWVQQERTRLDYGAILTRISLEYDRRFGASG
jgi:hypothetical protein